MQELKAFVKSRQPVNLLVVLANIVVFVVLSLLGNTEDGYFMYRHGACVAENVQAGEYYRLFTSMFLHFGFEHIVYNMLILIYLGDAMEKAVGKLRYLVIYLGGGVIGNIVSVVIELQKGESAISAGASGAIFAVVGALVLIVVINKGDLEEFSGRRLLIMAALSIAQGLTETGVDNRAHIGGFLAGFALAFLLGSAGEAARRQKRRRE